MKKIGLLIAFTGIMFANMAKASDDPSNTQTQRKNKITHNKLVRKTGKGISHGYYDLTHNKLTKVMNINDGNVKYKNQDDV